MNKTKMDQFMSATNMRMVVFALLHVFTIIALIVTVSVLFQDTNTLQQNMPSARAYASFYNNVTQNILFGTQTLIAYSYANVLPSGISNEAGVFTIATPGVYHVAWTVDGGTISVAICSTYVATITGEDAIVPFSPIYTQTRKMDSGTSTASGTLMITTTVASQNIGLFVLLTEDGANISLQNTAIAIFRVDI